MVALLALLPLLLAVIAVVAGGLLVLRIDGQSRHACRVMLLQEQARVAEILERLRAMNPGARSLRMRRTTAENMLKHASTPPLKAAAWIALQEVIAEQAVFGARQKALIMQGRQVSLSAPLKAKTSVRRLFVSTRLVQGETNVELGFMSRTRVPRFELMAKPIDSPTPDYEPPAGFDQRQLMSVGWSVRISALLPDWIVPLAKTSPLKLQASCSATLEKGKDKWVALLKTDRP